MDKRYPTPSWPADNHGIYHESKEESQAVTKLKSLNWYLGDGKNGQHITRCPFHPPGENIFGVYTESSDLYPYGWYSCRECNVCRHSPVAFYEKAGIEFHEIVKKSMVLLETGLFSETLSFLEYELSRCNDIFQRNGKLVRISVNVNTERIIINEILTEDIFRILYERCIFLKNSTNEDKFILCNLPFYYCSNIYKTQRSLNFKEVDRIATQPYLKPDGSIVTKPGYDQETKIFSNFKKNDYHIKPEPTRQDAENALQSILEPFAKFPFESENDKSAAASGCITSAIRVSLPYSPMYHCKASQSSSGKTKLMKCISGYGTYHPVPSLEFPNSNEECGKKMLALLMKGSPVIFFDNIDSDLTDYQSLCSILTDKNFSGRILGQNKITEVSTCALILSNGNNVRPMKDLLRRVIEINLLPTCENPAGQKFPFDPHAKILANRAHYVSLVLTMIRAWIVAGSPETVVQPIVTYNDWSKWCRQVLLWLGLPDPATSLLRALDDDPDRQILRRFLHAWYDSFKSQNIKLREAIEKGNTALQEVFLDINGGVKNLNRWHLGKWLSKHSKRTIDNLSLEKDESTKLSVEGWRVISK